jgi:hypothetical protein
MKICNEADYLEAHLTIIPGESRSYPTGDLAHRRPLIHPTALRMMGSNKDFARSFAPKPRRPRTKKHLDSLDCIGT